MNLFHVLSELAAPGQPRWSKLQPSPNYGIKFGEPPWLADIMSRYYQPVKAAAIEPVCGRIAPVSAGGGLRLPGLRAVRGSAVVNRRTWKRPEVAM